MNKKCNLLEKVQRKLEKETKEKENIAAAFESVTELKNKLQEEVRLKSASGGFGCYFGTTPQFEIPTRPNRNIFRNSQNLFLIA